MFLRQLFQSRFLTAVLLLGSLFYAAIGRTEVWADIRDNVITNNGVFDCTECHSYQKNITGGATEPAPLSRHAAPTGVNFDGATDSDAYINATALLASPGANVVFPDGQEDRVYERASSYINQSPNGYMPMDPTQDVVAPAGVIDEFVDAADLSVTKKASILSWALQGAPYAAPTATTSAATSIAKVPPSNSVGATLNATINTNVHSGTAVPGTFYYEYEEEVPGAIGTYDSSTTPVSRSSTDPSLPAEVDVDISGLRCGTQYNFRAVATNGSGTVPGSNLTLGTTACELPVIAGVTLTGTAPNQNTAQSTDEDTSKDFALTVSNIDPGSLQWSKTDGSKGTVTLISPTSTANNGSATVRYSPTLNLNGADTFTVTVNNMNAGTSSMVTFNMTINAINDQPAFAVTSVPSTSAIEDTLYSYQVEIDDPDDAFGAGLTIALSGEPFGMSVNPATGLITWTPLNGVASSGLVTVLVDDGHENGAVQISQQFTVTVSGTNDPPVITPGATTTATEDVQYSYQMQVTDIDDTNNGTDIGFAFVPPGSEPTGMSISNTGLITWTPLEGVTTSGPITVSVEDGNEDVSAPDTESFTITVTQVNDSPVVTPGAPTAAIENDNYSYQIVVSDDDDLNNGTDLTFTPSNLPTGMTVSASGLINWIVPRTGAAITHNTITVTVADGGEDSATSSAEIFNLAVSIVDTDNDTVADYSDNCPTVANVGQEDLDNDTVHILPQTDPNNFPSEGDVDPTARDAANALAESYLRGGDACDEDIDSDGLSNSYEDMFAFLDPMNPADASADEDGDGVSNLDEFLASTAPDVDSVGPAINAPADITVDATGLLTVVNLGTATGNDGNDGAVGIFKAAVGLTGAEITALEDPNTGCDLIATYEADIKPFRPGAHVVTWASCDSAGNTGHDEQIVNVRPLVSVNSGQSVGEGQTVTVDVALNGKAIAYPARVKYSISGTAIAVDDHDAVAGEVVFNDPDVLVGTLSFNVNTDSISEVDESIVVTLHSPANIALGNNRIHTVTVTEENVAPRVELKVSQVMTLGNTIYQPDGMVTLVADANDGNGDSLSFDWSASDTSLLAVATISGNQVDFDPNALTVDGSYKVKVAVSDGSSSVTVERLLLIKAAQANNWLIGQDDDNDGIDNLGEGYGDADADGIPDYLDSSSTPANAIENQTASLATSIFIETDPGLHIALGETAVAAQSSGVLIGMQDIADHGGAGGVAVLNSETDYTFYSGLLNFEISGLTDDIESVHVVIPLLSAIQADTVYRKFNSTGWFDFVEDDMNELRSAAGDEGTCPQPGSNQYVSGLSVGDLCLQLTIQDGGANDADGLRNYIVKDPGGLALAPEPEAVADNSAEQASGRAGSLSLWLLLMLSITVAFSWRLRLHQMINVRTLNKCRYSSSQK